MKLFVFALVLFVALCDAKYYFNGRPGKGCPIGKCPEVNGETPTYLPDRFNRSIFYECNNGKPIRLRCPKGLVFNIALQVCDFSSTDCEPSGPVGSCPATDSSYLTFLRDGANVSVFYICNRGEPIRFQCADGLIFNPRTDSCTRPI